MIPKEVKIALGVVAIIALMCGAGIMTYEFVKETPQDSYGITYNLNGGVNATSNPDTYNVNEPVFFSTPMRDGYIFDGWFRDEAMKTKITSTTGLTENLTLYAKWHQVRTFTIEYVLNGGVNSDRNPATYLEDSSVMFSQPYRTNSAFKGWHFNSDFSDAPVDYISRHTNSDITLYAEWETDRSGNRYTYETTGKYTLPTDWRPLDITGNSEWAYLNYVYKKGYHVSCKDVNTISEGVTAYWTAEHDGTDWTYIGEHTLTYKEEDKICKVYKSKLDDGETWTFYVGDDGVYYRMDRYAESDSDLGKIVIDMSYTLTDDRYEPMKDTYTIMIYDDEGISTTGSGTYNAMSEVYLTATGTETVSFGGWYSEDRTLSSSSDTIHIEMLMEDIVLYAQNTLEYDDEAEGGTEYMLDAPDTYETYLWTVYDIDGPHEYTDKVLIYTFNSAGNYVITLVGSRAETDDVYKLYRVQSNGYVNRSFTWYYNGIQYNMNINIDYDDYAYYKYMDTERERKYTIRYGQLIFDDDHTASFVVVDDYITTIAEWFHTKKQLNGWTELQTATCLLRFVQSIPHVSDLVSTGVAEYWRFPLETLYDQYADDEDTSFLYCAIAKALGYQTALLLFSGHMAASVYVNGISSEDPFICTVKTRTYTFYFCETSETEWDVADVPIGYEQNGYYYNVTVYGTKLGAVVPIYLL